MTHAIVMAKKGQYVFTEGDDAAAVEDVAHAIDGPSFSFAAATFAGIGTAPWILYKKRFSLRTLFVLMTAGNGGHASLAFMHPEHPSAPPGPEPFSGKGKSKQPTFVVQRHDARRLPREKFLPRQLLLNREESA